MAPEHIVILVPGGKTAAGRYCKLGEEDAPGKLILGDGVLFRVPGGLVIVRQPLVGLSGELLGSHRPQGLVPHILIYHQFLHHIGDTGPGRFLFNLHIQRDPDFFSHPLTGPLEYAHLTIQREGSQHFVLQKNGLCVFRPNLLQCRTGYAFLQYLSDIPLRFVEGITFPAAGFDPVDLALGKPLGIVAGIPFLVRQRPAQVASTGDRLSGLDIRHGEGMGMRRPVGIQKGFVCADTVLDQYQFFLIFWGVQGNKVLDRSLFHGVLLTQILADISLSVPSVLT